MIILILLIRNQNLGEEKSFVQDIMPGQEQRQDAKPDFIYSEPSNLSTMLSQYTASVFPVHNSQLGLSLLPQT